MSLNIKKNEITLSTLQINNSGDVRSKTSIYCVAEMMLNKQNKLLLT